jgi:hypothetical protein
VRILAILHRRANWDNSFTICVPKVRGGSCPELDNYWNSTEMQLAKCRAQLLQSGDPVIRRWAKAVALRNTFWRSAEQLDSGTVSACYWISQS